MIPWWLRRAVYRPLVALLSKRPPPAAAAAAEPAQPDWEYADEWHDPDMIAAGMRNEPGRPVVR
jgi:hypothetical protein